MRIFRRSLLFLAIMIPVVIAGLFVYLAYLGGMERIVNNQFKSLLGDDLPLEVTIDKIDGTIFTTLKLTDVNLYYRDSLRSRRLLYIPHAEGNYALSNFFQGHYAVEFLSIDSAVVSIIQDTSGAWIIPPLAPGRRDNDAPPSLTFNDLRLNSVTVELIRPEDTMRLVNMNLWLGMQTIDNTYAVDVNRLEFSSAHDRFAIRSGEGKLTYADGNLVFKDLAILADNTRLRLGGMVVLEGEPAGRLDFDIDNLDVAQVTQFVGPDLRGILDLNGNVSFVGTRFDGQVNAGGTFMIADLPNLFIDFRYEDRILRIDSLFGSVFDGCGIDGSGYIDFGADTKRYHLDAEVRRFNLKGLIENSFESDLNGHLVLDGEGFRHQNMRLNIETSLFESSFDSYPIHEAGGALTVTTDSLVFVDSFWVNYYENMLWTEGSIDYDGDMTLRVQGRLPNVDRWRGTRFFLEQPGGRGFTDSWLTGATNDPDISGYFVSDSMWAYEMFAREALIEFDIERFLTARDGSVSMRFLNGSSWGIPYDTAYAWVRTDSIDVLIDSVSLSNPTSQLSGSGRFEYGGYPMRLDLDSLDVNLFGRSFYNRDNIVILSDSLGFDVRQAVMGNEQARFSVEGRADSDESLDLYITVDQMAIRPWVQLYDTSLAVNGILSIDADLLGTMRSPDFRLVGEIDSLTYEDVPMGDLFAELHYIDRQMSVETFDLVSPTAVYAANGYLWLDLALSADTTIDRIINQPFEIEISVIDTMTAADSTFELVPVFLPAVEELQGNLHGNVLLTGTPREPHLEGSASFTNVFLKYFDLEHPFFADSVGVTMSDNNIIFDRMEAYVRRDVYSGRERYVYLDGQITVQSIDNYVYDVGVSMPREFPFRYELADITGTVEGEMYVYGETPPTVTGDLTLLNCNYRVEFAEAEEGSPILMAFQGQNQWDLDLNIDILSNYWIKNQDIDAEFAGQLNLIRDDGSYRFLGEMEILRGRGYLFDKTFQLEPGSQVFFDGNDTLNPRLEITATTRITVFSESPTDTIVSSRQIPVGLLVTGTLEEPQIGLADQTLSNSDLELTREDILPLIVANYYSGERWQTNTGFEQRMYGAFLSQVSQIGGRQLSEAMRQTFGIGVETFELDPIYGQELDPLRTRLTVGSYFSSNFYVYGRSAISGQTGQEVGFEYRFNRNVLFEGRRDEDEFYHLNLRLHWEF